MVAQILFALVGAARNPAGAVATGSMAREMHCMFVVPLPQKSAPGARCMAITACGRHICPMGFADD